jgi:hypothetical protein
MYYGKVILCQPDSEKGCCACCGLFNIYDISLENLTNFLKSEGYRLSLSELYKELKKNENFMQGKIRDVESHICPYQGFIDKSRPGCQLHPGIEAGERRDLSLFSSRICNDFLCAAHEILNDAMKRILIDTIHHWYYYSIAIVDPESFLWIVNCMESQFGISFQDNGSSDLRSELLTSALRIHAEYLNAIKRPIFFYSVPEYNLNKKDISLMYTSKKIKAQREKIQRGIAGLVKG